MQARIYTHTHTHLVNKGSYLGQDAPHGKVGLPLWILCQLAQQFKKLLSMLTSTTDIIQETREKRERSLMRTEKDCYMLYTVLQINLLSLHNATYKVHS